MKELSSALFGTYEQKIYAIAMVCNNAYQTLVESQGDKYKKTWRLLENDKQEVIMKSVAFRVENPESGPDVHHNIWMSKKLKDGWIFGETHSDLEKTSPLLVPFKELPEFQQKKGVLFNAIVDALSAQEL